MDVETLAVKLTRATMKLPIGPLSATLGQATPRFEQPTIDIRIVGEFVGRQLVLHCRLEVNNC